ncbi:MAG: hypothetical protein WED05_02685 [Candidatus Atabeyarchaeum deiterrae]
MVNKTGQVQDPDNNVARRVYIADIVLSGSTASGNINAERFTKVKIFGTLMSKRNFRSDGKTDYTVITVDDGSGLAIRIKAWGHDTKLLDSFAQGAVIDVIGRVRYGKEEIYIIPEIVKEIEDPNWEIVRELEIIREYLKLKKARIRSPDLKSDILDIIDRIGGNIGIEYNELVKLIKQPDEEEIKKALRELINEGLIFEPRLGRYRK